VFQQEIARRARPQIAERQLVLDRSPLIAVAFHGKDNGGRFLKDGLQNIGIVRENQACIRKQFMPVVSGSSSLSHEEQVEQLEQVGRDRIFGR